MMRWIAKLTGLFMATCRETTEASTDVSEGALPEGELRRVERHLLICPYCKAYRKQMEAAVKATKALPPESLTTDERRAALEAFRGRQAR